MFTFMFGVLGSVIFWVSYFGLSLFAGTFILKKVSPDSFKRLIGTYEKPVRSRWEEEEDDVAWFFLVLIVYLFWPMFLAFYLLKFILVKICIGSFRSAVIFADKNMPEIKISKQQEDKKD